MAKARRKTALQRNAGCRALQELAMAEPDPARAAQLMKQSAHALTHRVR
jgi:hypothetical protein